MVKHGFQCRDMADEIISACKSAPESKEPLSDDDIQKILDEVFGDFIVSRGFLVPVYIKIARAIEAAHDIREQHE